MLILEDKNNDMEKTLVGMLLRWPEKLPETDGLQAMDFGHIALSLIYSVICQFKAEGKPVDMYTVDEAASKKLGRSVSLDIMECIEHAVAPAKMEEYAAAIRENSLRRRMSALYDKAAGDVRDGEKTVSEVVNMVQLSSDALNSQEGGWVDVATSAIDTYGDVEDLATGKVKVCTTGIAPLDELTGGFHPGELTIIGARPSVGKSAFGMHCAMAAADQGRSVCFVTAEMSINQITLRLLANRSNLDGKLLRKAETITQHVFNKLNEGMLGLDGVPLWFLDETSLERIIAAARSKHARGECDILFIDYLQLLLVDGMFSDDWQRLGRISQLLKKLAKELNIPVVALSQLTRQTGPATLPRIDALRGSGNLEQDADNVILLHRVEYRDDKALEDHQRLLFDMCQRSGTRLLLVSVAKQRQGPIGIFAMEFRSGRMGFLPFDQNTDQSR